MAAPLWRNFYDRAEQAIGGPLERHVETPQIAGALATATRLRRAAGRRVDGMLAWALHQAGLPAKRDVREVQRSLARLEWRVREIGHVLEDQNPPSDDDHR